MQGLAGGHGCAFIEQKNVMQHQLQLSFDLKTQHILCSTYWHFTLLHSHSQSH